MTQVSDSKKKHRLLFVSNLFPDQEEPVRGLDNATLLHSLRRNFSIRVISPRPICPPWRQVKWKARESDHCFEPRYISWSHIPKIGDHWNARRMARSIEPAFAAALESFQPHLVLVSWLFPDGCAIAELCEKFDLPVVQITQGTDTHHYLEIPLRRRKILTAIKKSEAVICRSGDLSNRLERAGACGGKLNVVYNGVDTRIFHPRDTTEARKELELNQSQPLFLFVGNYLPVKDPLFLIEAVDRLNSERARRNDPLVRLILIGDGPLLKKMQAGVSRSNFPDLIDIKGRMNPDKIALHMNAADSLCLSSTNEGFPNVILEAMACGTPIVSTHVGGISELVDDSNGKLVPPQKMDQYIDALDQTLPATQKEVLNVKSSQIKFDPGWKRAANEYTNVLTAAIAKNS